MFTGLVQGLGEVLSYQQTAGERRFWIRPCFEFRDIEDGESIAINGVCLSVETHRDRQFSVYASAETLSKTTLGEIGRGTKVNLERALKLGQRMGGHIVSGHIDCVANVLNVSPAGESLAFLFGFPREFAPQVVAKGSVALDGISLTINECSLDSFTVNVIPDSQARTNIPGWHKGSRINMETDIIGKYIQRDAEIWRSGGDTAPAAGAIGTDFLARHGFL